MFGQPAMTVTSPVLGDLDRRSRGAGGQSFLAVLLDVLSRRRDASSRSCRNPSRTTPGGMEEKETMSRPRSVAAPGDRELARLPKSARILVEHGLSAIAAARLRISTGLCPAAALAAADLVPMPIATRRDLHSRRRRPADSARFAAAEICLRRSAEQTDRLRRVQLGDVVMISVGSRPP